VCEATDPLMLFFMREASMAVKLWIVVFWFVMPYRFVDDNQNFKRMYLNIFFDDKGDMFLQNDGNHL
jgi:hypothetical protein